MDKITLQSDSLNISIDPPLFSYITNIKLPFEIESLECGSYSLYDQGSDYDKRECICEFELSQTESASLNEFIEETRGNSVNLVLPSNSGFFPAGPDKGDSGTFSCIVNSLKHNGMQNEPFRYFKDKLIIYFTGSYPAYDLPSEISDGTMSIGSIDDLRFPEQMFDPDQMYAYYTELTEDSSVKIIDRGNLADQVTTQWQQKCNNSKAAALINEIVETIRINQTTITAQNEHFPFGINHGDNQVFDAFLIQNLISIKHNRFNEFEFSLKFLLEQHIIPNALGDSFFYLFSDDLLCFEQDGVQTWQ